jgi:hypothetical protein
MNRSCDHYEEIPQTASPLLIGHEPLLQFVADGFRRLGALFNVVAKSFTLAFERLVTEIEYGVGPSFLLVAHGFRRSGIVYIIFAKASPSPSNAWMSKSLNWFDRLL